jgi:hypothetical protein
MKSPTNMTDPALAKVGVRPINLHNRPCIQCTNCQRAWLPEPQRGRLLSWLVEMPEWLQLAAGTGEAAHAEVPMSPGIMNGVGRQSLHSRAQSRASALPRNQLTRQRRDR